MENKIVYIGFFNYKKKLNGVKRPITRMVCYENSLEEAKQDIVRRTLSNESRLKDYHISVYDITGDTSLKIEELKLC